MSFQTNKKDNSTTIVITSPTNIELELQKIWSEVRNAANGIVGIGIVSRIGFPISSSFVSQDIDDDKCAAMVASVISVADSIGNEFEKSGSFKQAIFTNSAGFLIFYDIGYEAILFCVVRTESTKLGLINYLIQQKMPIIRSILEK